MKKILLFILFFVNSSLSCFSIEEIHLEKEPMNLDYFSDVYYGKIDKDEDVSPILKLFSQKGLEFENSKINSVKLHFLYDGRLNYTNPEHQSASLVHSFTTVEPMISLKFNDNKSELMFDYNITRKLDDYSNDFSKKISRAYYGHKINKNQTILIGQGARVPNSYNGSLSTMQQQFVLKSQLGRTFGEVMAVGLRNIGDYKYLNYDIGLYDSTRYMKDFGNGLDFTGYLMVKPFADKSEAINNFKIGSGYNIGHNNVSYNMYSVYTGYDYDKFHLNLEYANSDGYNGIRESSNHADGFYASAIYDITDKLALLARYDYFLGNKSMKSSYTQEYTAGITYKLYKNMKFMINYVNVNHSDKPSSNMILFATRFII